MKKKLVILLLLIAAGAGIVCWLGVEPFYSSSAVHDLEAELIALHGEPYTGRAVDNGEEDMAFSFEPATTFLTNYNLRQTLGLDYQYQCSVTYTVRSGGEVIDTRTVTYTGIDPMGRGSEDARAYLDLDSKTES